MSDEDFIPLGDSSDAADDELLSPGEPAPVEVHAVDGASATADPQAHPGDSPFDRIRAAYERRLETKQLFMELPGWEGELLIEFGLLSPRDVKQLRAATRGARNDMVKVIADLLCAAHKGLSVFDSYGDPQDLVVNGERLRLADIGQVLPVEVDTDRKGFFALFQEGPRREVNNSSLESFANEVGRWMADTSTVVTGAVDLTIDKDGQVVSGAIDPGS